MSCIKRAAEGLGHRLTRLSCKAVYSALQTGSCSGQRFRGQGRVGGTSQAGSADVSRRASVGQMPQTRREESVRSVALQSAGSERSVSATGVSVGSDPSGR